MSRTMERGIKRTCVDHVAVEQTDPDYTCKYVARMAKEYSELPEEWKETFLEGISVQYRKHVVKLIEQNDKQKGSRDE